MDNNWSRRKFLITGAVAGAALGFNPLASWIGKEEADNIKKIVAKCIGIDTHNHMDVPFNREEFKLQHYALASELNSSGLSAICMTFQVDRPKLNYEGEAYERFITSLDEMDQLLIENNLTRALNYKDVKNSVQQKKKFVIQSVEGGHFIEGKLERLEIAYKRGIRHLGLMHDGQTSPPMGDIYTDKPQFNGLTQLGIDTIIECNRLGILVDLAHCNNEAINRAIEVSSKSMIISHTGLNTRLGKDEKMAKMMMPRLISEEQAKTFASAGGVIGVWTHLADTPLEFAENLKAMADVVGTEHICIGTDTKMALPNNVQERFGKKTNYSWGESSEGFLYRVVEAMLKNGFSEKEIIAITGGNYWRVFEKSTSA
ncbi:dipeptidase [Flavobacterium ajazii]|uniref:dipeptidase n=1 Tax=Flavobacterium ajazii TaxID=2692318 RepID=UPI0013D1BCB0|nr:membrane dipeptidase [Flavobacterium ajazii]